MEIKDSKPYRAPGNTFSRWNDAVVVLLFASGAIQSS
jgi:hypothetical protein